MSKQQIEAPPEKLQRLAALFARTAAREQEAEAQGGPAWATPGGSPCDRPGDGADPGAGPDRRGDRRAYGTAGARLIISIAAAGRQSRAGHQNRHAVGADPQPGPAGRDRVLRPVLAEGFGREHPQLDHHVQRRRGHPRPRPADRPRLRLRETLADRRAPRRCRLRRHRLRPHRPAARRALHRRPVRRQGAGRVGVLPGTGVGLVAVGRLAAARARRPRDHDHDPLA